MLYGVTLGEMFLERVIKLQLRLSDEKMTGKIYNMIIGSIFYEQSYRVNAYHIDSNVINNYLFS